MFTIDADNDDLMKKDLPLVTHHLANADGRDFVVGDLHGCIDDLQQLLDFVHFDKKKDRLFSTGDLINRGPNSARTLSLLEQPWFYPVLGNHDVMFLAYMDRIGNRDYRKFFSYNYDGANLTPNGEAELESYLDILVKVPFVRVIGAGTEERFQVLHAERIQAESRRFISDEDLDLPEDTLRQKLAKSAGWIVGFDNYGDFFDQLLWGRSIRYLAAQSSIKNEYPITRTFVGHTITVPRERGILEINHHIFLDTGGYLIHQELDDDQPNRFGLTLWNVHDNSGLTLRKSGIIEVNLITGI